jgi:hypothetical protein
MHSAFSVLLATSVIQRTGNLDEASYTTVPDKAALSLLVQGGSDQPFQECVPLCASTSTNVSSSPTISSVPRLMCAAMHALWTLNRRLEFCRLSLPDDKPPSAFWEP